MYASIQDARDEGVTVAEASDARLLLLLEEASRFIDRVTGWFFEPRSATFRMDGRGTPTVEPPVPPIRLDRLAIEEAPISIAPSELVVVGAPVGPGFSGPRLTRRHGRVFPRGQSNVVAEGRWGFTEEDGTPEGRTPLAIRRACLLLALRFLAPLSDDASFEARTRWRIVEERTRDQSYKLGALPEAKGKVAVDPDVDALLAPYLRPRPIGAA